MTWRRNTLASRFVTVVLLSMGAAHVTTIEYTTIHSEHPNVDAITPSQWRKR